MLRLAKTILREAASRLPVVRNRYYHWEFLRRRQSYKGIFSSFDAATAAIPQVRLSGYDHAEIATICSAELEQLNPADYPILFWMAPLLPNTRFVFDLGGNLGVAYFAYRKYLAFPAALRWLVCEVSATAAAGRDLVEKNEERQLSFTDRREEAEQADIYFTSGALQYIEEPFAEIIGRLRSQPRHLFINRVPLCDEDPFITLQHNGAWISPYRVQNRAAFIASFTTAGYELVDAWKITRSFVVLQNPERRVDHFHGMYFRLKAA